MVVPSASAAGGAAGGAAVHSIDSAYFLLRDLLNGLHLVGDVFAFIGLIYSAKSIFTFTCHLFYGAKVFFLSKYRVRNLITEYGGDWAVVTGATDGIGRAYATELARRGINIVLISRSRDKLMTASHELETNFSVKTRIIQVDFADGRDSYQLIRDELESLQIGILVNNVGIMVEHPMFFLELEEEDIWNHVNINCGAVTILSHIVLPQMVRRRKGAIVNVASGSALVPVPLLAVYSATKAYVDYVSRAIGNEYGSDGITVQSLIPFYVATNMTQYSSMLRSPSIFVPSAATYARSSIRTLGVTGRTTGYWAHELQKYIFSFFPTWLMIWLQGWWQRHLRKQIVKDRPGSPTAAAAARPRVKTSNVMKQD